MKLSAASKKNESGHMEYLIALTLILIVISSAIPVIDKFAGTNLSSYFGSILTGGLAAVAAFNVTMFTGNYIADSIEQFNLRNKSKQIAKEITQEQELIILKAVDSILNSDYVNVIAEKDREFLQGVHNKLIDDKELDFKDIYKLTTLFVKQKGYIFGSLFVVVLRLNKEQIAEYQLAEDSIKSVIHPEFDKIKVKKSEVAVGCVIPSVVGVASAIYAGTISFNYLDTKRPDKIDKKPKPEEAQKVEESAYNPPSWINYRENWQETVTSKEPLLAAVIKR